MKISVTISTIDSPREVISSTPASFCMITSMYSSNLFCVFFVCLFFFRMK